jgi:hypothetical protein
MYCIYVQYIQLITISCYLAWSPHDSATVTRLHRSARLLKQQSSITVYRLPSKENKLPFSVSIFSKQTEVCRFCFPFATNKQKLLFSVSSFSWRHGYIETLRHGDMETLWHGDMVTWWHGGIETWRHQRENRKQKPRWFAWIHLLFANCATGSSRSSVCWQRNKVIRCKRNKRTKSTCPSMPVCLSYI